jgi:hypothetical protein
MVGVLAHRGVYTIDTVDDGMSEIILKTLADASAVAPTAVAGESVVTSSMTFDAATRTIQTAYPGWEAAGFAAGQVIVVSGSASNDGSYVVASVDYTDLVLVEGETLADETTAGEITVTGKSAVSYDTLSMSFDAAARTITRDDGMTWESAGFAAGQIVLVAGSSHNDGWHVVQSASGQVLTLAAGETLKDEPEAWGVTVTGAMPDSAVTCGDFSLTRTERRDSITRSTGTWADDGFTDGLPVKITGTSFNDGIYNVDKISGDTVYMKLGMDLRAESIAAGRPVSIMVEQKFDIRVRTNSMTGAPALSFTHIAGDRDTITRSLGSWTADGFLCGQVITVTGAGGNDGEYQIDSISADGRTLTLVMRHVVVSATGVTGASVTGSGITPGIVKPRVVVDDLGSNIAREIDRLQQLKVRHYGNPGAIAGYDAQISLLKRQALDLGLIDPDDPGLSSQDVPVSPKTGYYVNYIMLPDIIAGSGSIRINSGSLTGAGKLWSNGDSSIVVVNASPYHLRVSDLEIPTEHGGLVLVNGLPVTGNADIVKAASAPFSGRTANFAAVAAGVGEVDPLISITSTFDPGVALQDEFREAPAPDIEFIGDVMNARGTVMARNAEAASSSEGAFSPRRSTSSRAGISS